MDTRSTMATVAALSLLGHATTRIKREREEEFHELTNSDPAPIKKGPPPGHQYDGVEPILCRQQLRKAIREKQKRDSKLR